LCMDPESRYELIQGIAVEIIKDEELKELLATKEELHAYDGFEPSGFAHIIIGLYRPLLLRDLTKAKIKFTLLLADSFAWINNKLGGDIEKIRYAASYFKEVWSVAFKIFGVDESYIRYQWHKEFFDDPEYWKKVLLIAKNHSLARTMRALTIAGRLASESNPTAFYFYPSMQCADIFHLKVDIAQLGLDQRKVNILAREIATEKVSGTPLYKLLGYEGHGYEGKPVLVHHRMLPALSEPPTELPGYDEDPRIDFLIASKMAKSKPYTSIYVHDSFDVIKEKLRMAYCPPKSKVKLTLKQAGTGQTVELEIENPILVYIKEIVFRAEGKFVLYRKTGSSEEYYSYSNLEKDYDSGKIHPLDLKMSLAEHLEHYIKPIRDHFEKGPGREIYEYIKTVEITR